MIPLRIVTTFGAELAYLSQESSSALYFAEAFGGVEDAKNRQLVVDSIYRLYKSKLLTAHDWGNGKSNALLSKWQHYSKRLLYTNPYDGDLDHYAVWTEWDLHSTRLSKLLVKKFNLNSPGNADWKTFEQVLNRVFEKHGVSWSDGPLVVEKILQALPREAKTIVLYLVPTLRLTTVALGRQVLAKRYAKAVTMNRGYCAECCVPSADGGLTSIA